MQEHTAFSSRDASMRFVWRNFHALPPGQMGAPLALSGRDFWVHDRKRVPSKGASLQVTYSKKHLFSRKCIFARTNRSALCWSGRPTGRFTDHVTRGQLGCEVTFRRGLAVSSRKQPGFVRETGAVDFPGCTQGAVSAACAIMSSLTASRYRSHSVRHRLGEAT